MRVSPLILVALLGLLAALPAPAGAGARTRTVTIEDVDFNPGTVKIRRGDRVRWEWNDGSTPHNVRSRGSRRFKGASTKTQGTHSARFRRRGTYRYVCTIHIGMNGKIRVR